MQMLEFQLQALKTWGGGNGQEIACGLGITGEAGEVADLIKKEYFHQHPRNPEKIKDELGDVLYYLAMCASLYEWTLDEVAQHNMNKLAARYPNGFESERSINRSER